ncbi:hypothetical protein Tco_0232063 [Tanacetum coccineum]
MSRDVITVGSTMRIPLLYRGEYSQWRERFMNYLEEQTDDEAMINSIQNGKIDRLEDRFCIQGLLNDIYSSMIAKSILLKIYEMLLKGRCVVLSIRSYSAVNSDPIALVLRKNKSGAIAKRKL